MVNVVNFYITPQTDNLALQNHLKTLDTKLVHIVHFNVLTPVGKKNTYELTFEERKHILMDLKNFRLAFQALLKNNFKNTKPEFELQWSPIIERFTKNLDGQIDAVTGNTMTIGLQSEVQKFLDTNKIKNIYIYPTINEVNSIENLSRHYYEKGKDLAAYVGSEIKLIPTKTLEEIRVKKHEEKKKSRESKKLIASPVALPVGVPVAIPVAKVNDPK